MSMLDHFPLAKARRSQEQVIKAIEQAYKDGYRNVLLEAPVGSGKSPIAITVAKYFGEAHILTPRKSLQNQYLEDFSEEDLVLMKGRSSYPCTYPSSGEGNHKYRKVVNIIEAGEIAPIMGSSCSDGPCSKSSRLKRECTGGENGLYPCPYNVAINVAQESKSIVHNLHSFIFQVYFAGHFERRRILILDEAHEMEGIIRGFAAKKITLPRIIRDNEIPTFSSLNDWANWMEQFTDLFSNLENSFGVTEREEFTEKLNGLRSLSESFSNEFVTDVEHDQFLRKTKFKFIPEKIGRMANSLILDQGEKRLLMSGTIYSKQLFCRNNGLNEDETCFIRIGSSFPRDNRPIYLKKKYLLDTSHKLWDQNFPKMVENIKEVFEVFNDVKGLIHTPSYLASNQIAEALKDTDRILTHNKDDLQQKLSEFYASTSNTVFLSPVCQQGVDFKYDRARFQIILRVPYLNTSDKFVEHQVKTNFPWYNYQALVIFGQQIGRVVRSEDDFGVTVLMDERFNKFLNKNRNVLPAWLMAAVINK